jgi:AraC-like DNA-binding protein
MKSASHAAAPPLRLPPFADELPAPIFFRVEEIPSSATYPALRHSWGEFIYSFCGLTEVKMGKHNLLAPPHLGLWIAPQTEHTCFNHQETAYCSLYIRKDLCAGMPGQTCALLVSPLVRAILEHLRDAASPETHPSQPQYNRLLRVLVDQLATCQATGSFMPHTDDPELHAILQALRDNPGDNRSLGELATAFHLTERTLMRRCRSKLGMSLTEWRQRLRLVTALPRLREGHSVESVALDLGYATSSAFIAMFRRLTGSSPGHFTS